MTREEDIESILYDGTEEQIANLPSGVSYAYTPEYDAMRIRVGQYISSGYGGGIPNCVRYFGNEHSF